LFDKSCCVICGFYYPRVFLRDIAAFIGNGSTNAGRNGISKTSYREAFVTDFPFYLMISLHENSLAFALKKMRF
jgi:hypothetical protein